MNEPRVVTPQEAQAWVRSLHGDEVSWGPSLLRVDQRRLAHTVATEPDRTRAAVVKALDDLLQATQGCNAAMVVSLTIVHRNRWAGAADAVESGTDG